MRLLWILAVGVLVTCGLVACFWQPDTVEAAFSGPEDVVRAYFRAGSSQDTGALSKLLDNNFRYFIAEHGSSVSQVLTKSEFLNAIRKNKQWKHVVDNVSSVIGRRWGDSAVVSVSAHTESWRVNLETTFTLIRVGGNWRIISVVHLTGTD